jgi:hypothetical protein
MGPVRKHDLLSHSQNMPAPDYSDEVCDEQIAALTAAVQEEIDSDEWELVDGPGW